MNEKENTTEFHREMNLNNITGEIIGSCIEVHKALGPGMLESSYKECLKYELELKNYKVECEVPVPVYL